LENNNPHKLQTQHHKTRQENARESSGLLSDDQCSVIRSASIIRLDQRALIKCPESCVIFQKICGTMQ